jgi:hypothetical protein
MSTNGGAGRGKRPAGVDAHESARWRSSSGPVNSVNPKKPVSLTRTDPCAVAEEDLKVLEQIHSLLRALNDAYAGGPRVGQLVANVPVLAARIVRRARKRFPAKANCTLPEAMTLIGNIGLESEIMQLLEDLTILSSELAAKKTGP